MRLYRIEMKDNPLQGPFVTNIYYNAMRHFNRFDSVLMDCNLWDMPNSGQYFCACHSIELLREWFSKPAKNPEIAKELSSSFIVAVFDVPDRDVIVGKSGKQCVFKRAEYSYCATHNPMELLA